MTLGLKYLNLSHCKLPIDALKHLLLGLACNEVTGDVELNISNNNIGGAGAGVVENALPGDQRRQKSLVKFESLARDISINEERMKVMKQSDCE